MFMSMAGDLSGKSFSPITVDDLATFIEPSSRHNINRIRSNHFNLLQKPRSGHIGCNKKTELTLHNATLWYLSIVSIARRQVQRNRINFGRDRRTLRLRLK
ncbi:hypothetical protein EVAR_17698_1 [Eumeta japonica]|uniref:Uncharacterized protein n=1 Tax=Eumeta variegata TaxID=151549 RepID=A0A4C1USG0_EUMVA|nr:hypothetical protein EVAR_17698_1 [Eumeta japonica]